VIIAKTNLLKILKESILIISYAQNMEDIILYRALSSVENGVYFDVGANDPIIDSVTKLFYLKGWRGVNVEPLDHHYKNLCSDRPQDTNLKVVLGSSNKKQTFYEIEGGDGLSTLKEEYAKDYQKKEKFSVKEKVVECKCLSEVWNDLKLKTVHFLKIDVEGAEEEVLKGIDLEVHRPWIIVVEATYPFSHKSSHLEWEELILTKNYRFSFFDGLNRYYVGNEVSQLAENLAIPATSLDDYIKHEHHESKTKLTEIKGSILFKLLSPVSLLEILLKKLILKIFK